MNRINIEEKFARFTDHWRPQTIAELNGQEVKLVKVQGTFPWHFHEEQDEMFLVWKGRFRLEFHDHVVEINPGEMIVVPRGVEHRTAADTEAEVLVFEPGGMRNTGNVEDPVFTSPGLIRL